MVSTAAPPLLVSRRREAPGHFTLSTQMVMLPEPIDLTWMRTPRFRGILTPASGASAYQYVLASLNFGCAALPAAVAQIVSLCRSENWS